MNDISMPVFSNDPWSFADYGVAAGSMLLLIVMFLAVVKFRREFYERHGRDWRDDL